MSKLIGTNPNQVPSNADLGTAAFMDKKEFLLSKGSDISAIAAVIPKTAVDVFIYDTSKDSDGGAWRKRTQHTSWYNERLNTTIRGSRREFPVVAVIVATTAGIYIYDGDDPSLPFWRLFEAGYNSYGGVVLWDPQHLSLSALNGIICVGNRHGNVLYAGNGVYQYKLISDIYQNDTKTYSGKHSSGVYSPLIYGSNDTNTVRTHNLVNYSVSDVSMAVLPDAKIDPATGLPVPTIAVATNGGVSVIKDNGTVVDIKATSSSFYYTHQVSFTEDNKIILLYSYSGVADDTHVVYYDIPNADVFYTAHTSSNILNSSNNTNSTPAFLPAYNNSGSSLGNAQLVASKEYHGGNLGGLANYSPSYSNISSSLSNKITSTYNTG